MFIRPGPGGAVSITNVTLKDIIVIAWHVLPFQISGGLAWIDSVHFDVIAKPEVGAKPPELALMLQTLLEDRFQLTVHHDTKELPIYALELARKDGKLGPGMQSSREGDCKPLDPNNPPPPVKPGERPVMGCGGIM